MTILLLVVFITLFVSANCSLYEAVLYSARVGTLEAAKSKERTRKIATGFIAMRKDISKPIAAILILNTLANTAGATIAGMFATEVLGTGLVPLFSVIFTLGILFISEIIPKTAGAVHWRALWPLVFYPIKFMQYALYPAILFTQKLSRLLTKQQRVASITEDEILSLVHLGAREGEISKDESQMVKNIINLEDHVARDIMTPRRVLFSLEANTQAKEASSAITKSGFNRVPVYEGDKENIIGYVIAQDVISAHMDRQESLTLKSLIRPISFISEDTNCLTLLTSFLKKRRHISVVSDDFGGVDGIVTLEDLIETVLGHEIVDETDQIVDMQESARKKRTDNEGP